MRKAVLALVSVCAAAACNPSAPGGGDVFPDLSSGSYRAEATIYGSDGETMPVVMIRDGRKQRMEMTTAEGQTIMIVNPDTGEDYVISNVGGQQMAMRISQENSPVSDPAAEWSGEMAANATRTGTCSVAGENGVEWTRAAAEDGDEANSACVTNDGIILRAKEGERTVWETTSVQRGAQSADLFTLPAGVQVMDLGNMMQDAMRQAQEAAGQ
jgi:hypothetical protein